MASKGGSAVLKQRPSRSGERPGFHTPKLPRRRKPDLPEGVLTATALDALNETLRGIYEGMGPRAAPVARFAGLFSDDIPLACGGQYNAVVTGSATRFELDYPGGDTADEVSQKAYDRALQAAKDDAKDQLNALAKRVKCDSDCFVIRTPKEPTYDMLNGTVDAHYTELGLAVQYNWTFTLRAQQTFKCVRTTPAM